MVFSSLVGAGTLPDIAFSLFRGLSAQHREAPPCREPASMGRERSAAMLSGDRRYGPFGEKILALGRCGAVGRCRGLPKGAAMSLGETVETVQSA